jgi:1-pyrroline-5-carboxylate dehydrogenase
MLPEFKNEPMLDFSIESNRQKQMEALQFVQCEMGSEYDLIIGGERLKGPKTFNSTNPGRKTEIVGTFQSASVEQALKAVEVAAATFETWKRVPARERADLLLRCSAILRQKRFESNAWMICEVGKTWPEADADTAEAIDFLEFYAREALRYAGPQPMTRYPGEENELRYLPLGVGAVVPPWNFPCAIMAGMTTAAIVTGNTVVLKPSSDAPAIAAFFMRILEEAGMPDGVVNFITGSGANVGDPIVQHPKVRFIAFTGSKEVGLHINLEAAKTRPGQIWIKRVIAEMGGKDFIIVDDDCDLDAAVQGVLASAFGYQGQKCSACSRAIIHEKVYDEFVAKIGVKVKDLTVGPPWDPAFYMGPVINEKALKSMLEYIESGKKDGRLIAGGSLADGNGYYLQPTIFADIDSSAKIFREEIFGPVLAITKAKDFDDAVRLSNESEYGLTGAIFSNNREHVERAKNECFVGNFYVNRKCTGALVGVHPFGGFNMSGTDSKAGGRDYLALFTQAQAISEKNK